MPGLKSINYRIIFVFKENAIGLMYFFKLCLEKVNLQKLFLFPLISKFKFLRNVCCE